MELSFLANKIRKVVMENIGDRKGFHFDNLNDDVLQEIKDSLEIDILKAFEVPAKDRWQRFVTAYSAIKRAERMDANDIYERSQEAAHYNWLDEENEKLEAKIDKLEKENKTLKTTCDNQCDDLLNYVVKIDKLEAQNKELVEALDEAVEEMIVCNRDAGANYYFDSCNKTREVLAKIKSEDENA